MENTDNRPQADCLAKAIRLFLVDGESVIVCTKIKITADHCPNKEMRQVCTTAKQIHNFYQ